MAAAAAASPPTPALYKRKHFCGNRPLTLFYRASISPAPVISQWNKVGATGLYGVVNRLNDSMKKHITVSCADDGSVRVLRGLAGIGVALQLHRNALEFLAETVEQCGDRVELRVLGRRVLVLSNPRDVETVLVSKAADFGRPRAVKNLRPMFGDGIYSSEGERWRKQRQVLQAEFHHDGILKYSSIIVRHMAERVRSWRYGQEMNAFGEMTEFTADLMCEVIFGRKRSRHAKAVPESVSTIFENLRDEVLYLSLWRKLPFPRSRRWKRAIKTLNTAINSIIAERRLGGGENGDLLDLLLGVRDENGEGMSDEYVHNEVVTMFVAGQETSAVSLSWAIALLAQHSGLQEEAAAEIAHVTSGREVTAEDYPRLRLLHAIVYETLRLYPPLWTVGRNTIRDTVVGNLPVCAGTQIWIPIRQIHRNARWFPQPDRFNPYRWRDGLRGPQFSYLPFGAGSRKCVARHFAMAELVLGLATMLARFRFQPVPGTKLEMGAWLTLRPKNGVPVVVLAR